MYGYLMAFYTGEAFGKAARFLLSSFGRVSVHDRTASDSDLKGFIGEGTKGTYGFLCLAIMAHALDRWHVSRVAALKA